MANKEVLDQINALRIRRTLALLEDAARPIAETLGTLVESWLREADLLATSQKKGWQSEAKTLGSAVVLLKLEIAALDKLAERTPSPTREPVTGPTPTWTNPAALDQLVADSERERRGEVIEGVASCPALEVHPDQPHEPHAWVGAMNKLYRCSGALPFVQLVTGIHTGPCEVAVQCSRCQDASDMQRVGWFARHGIPLSQARFRSDEMRDLDHAEALFLDLPRIGTADVAAYLSGAVDELPGMLDTPSRMTDAEQDEFVNRFRETGGNSVILTPDEGRAIHDRLYGVDVADVLAVMERIGLDIDEAKAHQQIDKELAHVHAEPMAPLLTEATAPDGPPSRVPPTGAHLVPHTWAELAKPADPSTIPDHLSPSQLSTLDLCPAQARISRYEGNPGIPLWGGVGGTAFHSAVEEIERNETLHGDKPDVPALWDKHFQLTVMKTIVESGVPMDMWHASSRGKENYSWWLVEGGEMLRRYFMFRFYGPAWDERKVLILPDGRPAIELELELKLDSGLPVKVILDIVWQLPDGSLEIWDHKTRQDFMGPIVDTIQLGTQGWALVEALKNINQTAPADWYVGMPAEGHGRFGLRARYFDARKGTLTPAFDPLDKHPIAELKMRYADADDKRRNRPAIPVRSNLCKACPVAYLCPVGSKLS